MSDVPPSEGTTVLLTGMEKTSRSVGWLASTRRILRLLKDGRASKLSLPFLEEEGAEDTVYVSGLRDLMFQYKVVVFPFA